MLEIYGLRTEYKINPLGMDEPQPRFFYKLRGDSLAQSARRLQVEGPSGECCWDSGWVESGESIQIVYAGTALCAHSRYHWRVKVRDEQGRESDWSQEDAWFETGFLGGAWQAQWIAGYTGQANLRPVQRMRRQFNLPQPIQSARLYITSLGLYEAYLNGEKVGDAVFTPGWTDYYTRVQYQAYDVTELLQAGENCLAVQLGEGWYCGHIARHWYQGDVTYGGHPALLAQLQVTCADGSTHTVITDGSWEQLQQRVIRYSDIYQGEHCEYWRENPAWKTGAKVAWSVSPVHVEEHQLQIDWQDGAPVRVREELPPRSITRRANGNYVVDFGQNLTGRERLHLKNTLPGTLIHIRHGEMLNPDGSVYTENLRSAAAETVYVTGGNPEEVYEPLFTFFGFRYLEISGWPGELTDEMLCARVIYSDLPVSGHFQCSNPLLNQLYHNIVWGQKGNFLDVPTDCPQRDERYGWTGDTQVFANTATFNFFCPEFYRKWLRDLNANQSQGHFPAIAPNPYQRGHTPGATAWSDAGLIVPWIMYQKYGDTEVLQRYCENMSRWLEVQVEAAGGSLLVKNARYGDWLNLDAPTSEELISTAYLAGMHKLLAEIYQVLGREQDCLEHQRKYEQVRKCFGENFFSPEGELLERTQTAALLALHFRLVPENAYANTVNFLLQDIRETRKLHLSTGFVGTPLLLPVLSSLGQTGLAYALLEQTTYPGWLYPVTQGATTCWERWNSWTEADGFGNVGMNSFNHYAYGAVAEWFFQNIGGLRMQNGLSQRGGKQLLLAPEPGQSLDEASVEYETLYGKVTSHWWRQGDRLIWEFSLPCNTSARIVPPGDKCIPVLDIPGLSLNADGDIFAAPGSYRLEL